MNGTRTSPSLSAIDDRQSFWLTMNTLGNAVDFGDLLQRDNAQSSSSCVRGVRMGGGHPTKR